MTKQLDESLSDIEPERRAALIALAADVADASDGATLAQLANLLVKHAKREGLGVTRAEALRIMTANEAQLTAPR